MSHDDYYAIGMDYLAEQEEEKRREEEMAVMERAEEQYIMERYKNGLFKYIYYVLEDLFYYLEYKLALFIEDGEFLTN
ncbi:MAG: hypothetical protein EBY22_11980 [Gammaproteobacteria bacterium]|nr:hypothetical protein [Gammaproteobacteria bacterium]